MKATIIISDYIQGRYNETKLEKLKAELEKLCAAHKTREHQVYPADGIEIKISMSAKYQTPYVKVTNWGEYKAVGEFEHIVKDALENRGFEVTEEGGDEDFLKISFE